MNNIIICLSSGQEVTDCPNLIGLRAGEASRQRSTTSRKSSSERRATVGQERLQVTGEQAFVKGC